MYFGKFFLIISVLLTLLVDGDSLKQYFELDKDKRISIKFEDLPSEFNPKVFEIIEDFIQKTKNLEYECLMYFDYVTGKILKFEIGETDRVKMDFNENDFEGCHIASIHNHPSSVYSPPSGKNFGILLRNFEDYELVVGQTGLWILKAKGVNLQLNLDLKYSALMILDSCQEYARN